MTLFIKSGFFLVLLGGIISASSICETNINSRQLIQGDNSNNVAKFLRLLNQIKQFSFAGDVLKSIKRDTEREGTCREAIQGYRHRKAAYSVNNTVWPIFCWEPAECSLVKGRWRDDDAIIAYPKKWYKRLINLFQIRVNAILLPLDEVNTIAYTLLPYDFPRSAFFVTSMLSGCHIFVATASNTSSSCNIIVMHSNRMGESNHHDNNHRQAMFVLERVTSVNQECNYQIERRWAGSHHREKIESRHYPYITDYYDMLVPNFFYGFNLGGHGRTWNFCIKEVYKGAHQDKCYQII